MSENLARWNETRRLFIDIVSAADNAQHVLLTPDSGPLASQYVSAIEKRLFLIKKEISKGVGESG